MTSIYRDSEVERLRTLLEQPPPGVSICGISGPGGVGKTFLVEHVFDKLNILDSDWLLLSADGLSTQLRGDLCAMLEQRFAPKVLPSKQHVGGDPFARTRRILELHRGLSADAAKQLSSVEMSGDAKRLAQGLLKAGHVLNSTIPKSKEYLDFGALPIDA